MGSRGRSIRLRIYFLVAIPLIAMVGLLAYVVGTTIDNAVSLDRAPNLIYATAVPAADFSSLVQDERAAAVVYLFPPTAANLAAYGAAIKATDRGEPAFLAAMSSSATLGTRGRRGAGDRHLINGLKPAQALRLAVTSPAVTPLAALSAYSDAIQDEPRLFLAEADSLTTHRGRPGAGDDRHASAREGLSEEYALLAGVLAGQRMSLAARGAFTEVVATRQVNLGPRRSS